MGVGGSGNVQAPVVTRSLDRTLPGAAPPVVEAGADFHAVRPLYSGAPRIWRATNP